MRIYLATPYSHPDPQVRHARFLAVNAVAAQLMRAGHHVFSPISHCHPIALAGDLPKDWEFWEGYDKMFIGWAEELHVLCQEGWNCSQGIAAEILLAQGMGKPVRYIPASIALPAPLAPELAEAVERLRESLDGDEWPDPDHIETILHHVREQQGLTGEQREAVRDAEKFANQLKASHQTEYGDSCAEEETILELVGIIRTAFSAAFEGGGE